MSLQQQPDRPLWPKLVLRRTDQAAAAVLLAASLVAIGGWAVWQGKLRGRLIDIDRAAPMAVDFKIDINEADWPELALLPGVGETLGKRIVDNRQASGPFRDLNDLRRVRGIGPKTLEGMRPYLLPLPDLEATAGESGPRERATVN